METTPLRAQILDTIIRKSTLKQRVFDNTFGAFNSLKETLLEMASEMDDELDGKLDRRVRLEYRDRGKFEAQLQVANDILIFQMHTDVFEFGSDHLIWQNPYVQADRDNSYCGLINIYNFLSDSFKFNRNADEGYLIGRIFINRERRYFAEGKQQNSMRAMDFGKSEIGQEALVAILESAIGFALRGEQTRDGGPVQHQDGQLEVRDGQTPRLRLRRRGHLTGRTREGLPIFTGSRVPQPPLRHMIAALAARRKSGPSPNPSSGGNLPYRAPRIEHNFQHVIFS